MLTTWITVVILELIHAKDSNSSGKEWHYPLQRYSGFTPCIYLNGDNCPNRENRKAAIDQPSFCPINLMVVYWTTMVITGNGELGFDSGEGA